MKANQTKSFTLSLALLATLGLTFSACGTDDSLSTESEVYEVIVERGKVYEATVVDSSSPVQLAVQQDGENVYLFSNQPVFPVRVNGGWIDVNDNGIKDEMDILLDIEMESYSNVVTMVSTYIADSDADTRAKKLEELRARVNEAGVGLESELTAAELLRAPSEATQDAIVVANAIFKDMKENAGSLQNVDVDSIMSLFSSVEALIPSEIDKEALSVIVEEALIANMDTVEHVIATLEDYSTINIFNNIDPALSATLSAAYTNLPEFTSSMSMRENFSCEDYGFEGGESKNLDNNVSVNVYYDANGHSCLESDYALSTYAGSSSVLSWYNLENQ